MMFNKDLLKTTSLINNANYNSSLLLRPSEEANGVSNTLFLIFYVYYKKLVIFIFL